MAFGESSTKSEARLSSLGAVGCRFKLKVPVGLRVRLKGRLYCERGCESQYEHKQKQD